MSLLGKRRLGDGGETEGHVRKTSHKSEHRMKDGKSREKRKKKETEETRLVENVLHPHVKI
jgi:hypothetical protein